jgi:beta-lactamase class D
VARPALRAGFAGRLLVLLATVLAFSSSADAGAICTLVTDPAGTVIHEEGDCDRRVTPASTFKVPLAVMGFDAGFLVDSKTPTLPFVEGYPDWIAAWRSDTGPARWMQYSVVWYSQQIAAALGAERLIAYARAFGYGNADFSGDRGQDNGLERSWISSSLLVSPREQAAFIGKLLDRTLPVSASAIEKALMIVQSHAAGDGWTFWGKTGSAYPRRADGNFDRGRGWGWYAGWAARGDDLLIVVRLHQADGPGHAAGGNHTRDRLIADWPDLAAAF